MKQFKKKKARTDKKIKVSFIFNLWNPLTILTGHNNVVGCCGLKAVLYCSYRELQIVFVSSYIFSYFIIYESLLFNLIYTLILQSIFHNTYYNYLFLSLYMLSFKSITDQVKY